MWKKTASKKKRFKYSDSKESCIPKCCSKVHMSMRYSVRDRLRKRREGEHRSILQDLGDLAGRQENPLCFC